MFPVVLAARLRLGLFFFLQAWFLEGCDCRGVAAFNGNKCRSAFSPATCVPEQHVKGRLNKRSTKHSIWVHLMIFLGPYDHAVSVVL